MTNNFLPMFTWCSYTLVAVVVTVVVLAFFSSAPLAWFRLELFSFICDAGHSWLSSRTSFYFCCSPFAISHFATAHKMWATRIKRMCVCVCVCCVCWLWHWRMARGKAHPTPLSLLARTPHNIMMSRQKAIWKWGNCKTTAPPGKRTLYCMYGIYGRHAAYLAQIKNIYVYIFPNKTTRSCPAAAMPSV